MNNIRKMISVRQVLIALLMLCMMTSILLAPAIHVLAEGADSAISNETDDVANPDDTTETPVEPTQEPVPTAEPVPTDEPTPTQEPLPPTDPYKISFGIPKDWTNAATTAIKLHVADKQNYGWQTVEIKFKNNGWVDVSGRFAAAQDDKIDVEISDNGKLFVRVTDRYGNEYKEEADINCFDRSAPTVTAGINDRILHVEAVDTQSGLAGIQVNSLLFTTLENGILNVRFEEVLIKYEKLAIRAFDYAGNFSEPVTLDNPYYGQPFPEATPTPIPTPVPTAVPQPTATPRPTRRPPQDSQTTTTSVSAPAATSVPLPTAEPVAEVAPTPEPIITTEYIPLGPGMPFKAQGNMSTLDMLYSAHTNKQFITVQTRSGAPFFLVIDYDKPIDEEAELYETYFLNLVDERDLLALLSGDEVPTPTPEVIIATPEPTAVPVATEPPVEPVKESGGNTILLGLVGLFALGGGGAYMYMQSKKGKQKSRPNMDDFGLDDDDEDEMLSEQDE